MPTNRPKKDTCFIERDATFFQEVSKLDHSVVIYGKGAILQMEVHEVVAIAEATGLVRKEELRVAKLSGERFLLNLPRGLAVETFVKKLPGWLWDEGFEFRQWSVLDDANVKMPRFKVLLDLIGVPMHLQRENYLAKVISKYGIYLGSVTSEHDSDCSTWRLALATDDLNRIPLSVDMVAGGLEYPVEVDTIHWEKGSLYQASDFPLAPQNISRPPQPPPPPATEEEVFHDIARSKRPGGDELIHCSKRVLFDLCKGLKPEQIPPEVKALLFEPGPSGEVSMEVLNDLVFATDNQPVYNEDDDVGQNTVQKESTTHDLHHEGNKEPMMPQAAETLGKEDPSGTARLPCAQLETNSQLFGSSAHESGSKAASQVPEGERESRDALQETAQLHGHTCVAGHETTHETEVTGNQPRMVKQTIGARTKPGQSAHRRTSKLTQLINTSQHNRFRGHVGRGRGKNGPLPTNKWVASQQAGIFKQQRASHREQTSHQISRKGKEIQIPLTIAEIKEAQAQLQCKAETLQRRADQAQAQLELEGLGGLKRKSSAWVTNEEGHKRPTGPSGSSGEKKPVQINLNPEGHYQVSLEDDFCKQIGEGCGLKKTDVIEALQTDNRERTEVPTTEVDPEGIDQSAFDTEPEEELGSEEE